MKLQNGLAARIGQITDIPTKLKKQIESVFGVSTQQQRLFFRKNKGTNVKLDEGWRSLDDYGIKLSPDKHHRIAPPWQRTKTAESTDADHAQSRPRLCTSRSRRSARGCSNPF